MVLSDSSYDLAKPVGADFCFVSFFPFGKLDTTMEVFVDIFYKMENIILIQ